MDGIRDHHVMRNRLYSKRQISQVISSMRNLDLRKKEKLKGDYLGRGRGLVEGKKGDKRE
jgi:hypothetical protein